MPRMATDERSRKIVAAASTVIVRDGLAKATTRHIADEAGVPLGIIHYVFRSKQELLTAVYEQWVGSIAGAIESVPAGIGLGEAGRRLAHTILDWMVEDPNPAVAQYELLLWAVRSESEHEIARRLYERYVELIGGALARSAEPGTSAGEVDAMCDRVLIIIDGTAIRLLSTGDADDARRMLDLMLPA
jgi:TetR/AcrR family transcriptional regulator, regulator of biofilm formation and stress response